MADAPAPRGGGFGARGDRGGDRGRGRGRGRGRRGGKQEVRPLSSILRPQEILTIGAGEGMAASDQARPSREGRQDQEHGGDVCAAFPESQIHGY